MPILDNMLDSSNSKKFAVLLITSKDKICSLQDKSPSIKEQGGGERDTLLSNELANQKTAD